MRALFGVVLMMVAAPLFAQDYYVYVRTYDRLGVRAEDNPGRSKRGDIVHISEVSPTNTPTEKEKAEWLILRVNDIPADLAAKAQETWYEVVNGTEVPKAYRRYKLDLDRMGLPSKGLYEITINPAVIQNRLKQKTAADLTKYEMKRLYQTAMNQPVYMAKAIDDFFVPKAYAVTEVVSKINCATEDYNTLTLWEDAKDGDLMSLDQQQTAHVYDDDGVLVDGLSISGSTCDETRYMKVTVPSGERHNGTVSQGAYLR